MCNYLVMMLMPCIQSASQLTVMGLDQQQEKQKTKNKNKIYNKKKEQNRPGEDGAEKSRIKNTCTQAVCFLIIGIWKLQTVSNP